MRKRPCRDNVSHTDTNSYLNPELLQLGAAMLRGNSALQVLQPLVFQSQGYASVRMHCRHCHSGLAVRATCGNCGNSFSTLAEI